MADEERFEATLERGDRSLGWTIARLPFQPRTAWPAMLRLRIAGEMRGPAGSVLFRSSLFPDPGSPASKGFYLLITKDMQKRAGVALGGVATFTLHADLSERPVHLPDELGALLDEAEGLRAWYEALSESARRDLGKWISSPKTEEGRLHRAQQAAERMLSAMEAETELPPQLAQAFRPRPKAYAGWVRMTPQQRRSGLMAVFYYQTPDARQRRINKLLDDAERRA